MNPLKGSINVSHIYTGKSIMKICHEDPDEPNLTTEERRYRLAKNEALTDITALYYNEDYNEIYR